jgi:hypothetical protein
MTPQLRLHDRVKESEIEEALVSDLRILQSVLGLSNEVKLIARQLHLRNRKRRIDLLLVSGKQLVLVELKVTPFSLENKGQILEYKLELEHLQNHSQLPAGEILCFLLVTDYLSFHFDDCRRSGVALIKYAPESVLKNYYSNLLTSNHFLRVKPKDYGVFNLGLMNRTLLEVQKGKTQEEEIAKSIKLSTNSVHNHLKTSIECGFVRRREGKYFLTDLGDKYTSLASEGMFRDTLSDGQAEVFKEYVTKAPFSSSVIFGIYAILESAFLLARNSYPIDFKLLTEFFTVVSGKQNEWKSARARQTATYTFLNFAIDLGLLGKIGSNVVITPSGFKFMLMLQLHKSIEMIDSLQT